MFTKEQLKTQLTNLGVPTNVPVIVHTSLKAVGETEGRSEDLLEVLIEHCTKDGGLLCIPTHTWSYAREEGRIAFDLTKKESCVGALTVVALNHPKAVRSMHPTHSMVVFGDEEKVKEFVKGEENFNTPTAPDSCYGKIYKQNGYVFTVTNTPTLIQTGQLIWPIPVLAVGGMLLIAVGIMLLHKKRKNNA